MAKKRSNAGAAQAAKKAKIESKPEKSSKKTDFLSHHVIGQMVEDIINEDKYNNIVPLLEQFDLVQKTLSTQPKTEALQVCESLTGSLLEAFKGLIEKQTMVKTKDEKRNIIAAWLTDKFDKYRAKLLWLINSRLPGDTTDVQTGAQSAYLEIVKQYTEHHSEFPLDMYQDFVHALVSSTASPYIKAVLLSTFQSMFLEHEDLQVNLFQEPLVKKFNEWKNLEGPTKDIIFENFYQLIREGVMFDDDELSGDNYTSVPRMEESDKKAFKENYQRCIFAWVRMAELSADQYKQLLNILGYSILPYLSSPSSMMDFLTDSLDQEEDEIIPLLVINSIWELMKKYNLEYPDFFTRLYYLLTPSLLYTRYRARFFRLLDLFLSSTHLSANLVASFIKRLARLAMTSSAPGVVIVFPFIYNLLKRHPSCMIMLQNPDGKKNPNYEDPFDEKETNPQKTGAIGSSLWELETLQSHYHPNIATLAKIFSEPFRKPSYNMEDFLDWTYKSLLDSEEKRKYKGLAALEYEEWETLFGKENAFMEGWVL